MSLAKIADELLQIHLNWNFYCMSGSEIDFDMQTFVQLWGNTTGGFEGFGGSAMTEQRTYVFISKFTDECLVFFGSRFAYSCRATETFLSDVSNCSVCGLSSCKGKYDILKI